MPYPLYHVDADIVTGEWTGEPEPTGQWVESAEWAREPDADHYYCDTYEVETDGVTETRAVKVFWVRD